ncbi:MAG TPA: YqhA family protein [Ktedonobacteraceae bacterium]|nr:YqhA family protein [Ktedonobacteraceae bacterium]
MLGRILAGSRYLVIIAVVGAYLSALFVLIYGGLTIGGIIIAEFTHPVFTPDAAKHIAVECIEMIDLFLLGPILYIVSLGLYSLFINDHLPLPSWLNIHNLESLKENLVGVIIVLLAVTFLGYVVTWDGSTSIWAVGVAVGFVVLALSLFLRRLRTPPDVAGKQPATQQQQPEESNPESLPHSLI